MAAIVSQVSFDSGNNLASYDLNLNAWHHMASPSHQQVTGFLPDSTSAKS